jgi:integrase/recombinase XerD
VNEAIQLDWPDVDFDNLLVKLHGKGAKERLVPFSFELRRVLWRWKQGCEGCEIVFATRTRQRLGQRNCHRDVRNLCRRLGIKIPERMLHAFRHSFSLNYERKGGNAFALQRVLGHSDLTMTRKYVNLAVGDLQAAHENLTLLR